MRLCRKCGAKEGSTNCCENGSLVKKEPAKAPTKAPSKSPEKADK